ncbi:helix-turn-helix domain-containing protein [Kineosporia sp. A_224]|uniref:helix-turn-helix domain-containing protein n=1 Tax=Kineosporia sp. A_224 TaxID=1962180 RepID=UPI000B4B0B59|nr:XRE family transcriptional regulator [Kineosporia sp. A_224]
MAKDDGVVLAGVGPRLRALRERRGTTLARLAEETGISVSTLSRLESGQRRPTLELLLPLATAYGVGLDELVGTGTTQDPRVRPEPIVRHGVTFVPLTRRPGGVRAYKQVFPPGAPATPPRQGSHDGYDWVYVLTGRVRLLLGEQDLVLTEGEVAEFDTRVPHSLSNAGPGVAEVINLFGPQGERVHVRARTAARGAAAAGAPGDGGETRSGQGRTRR